MENPEFIKVILTSSIIAALLSAIISAIVSIKLKNLDYKNEYFKKILDKRLDAYKFIETQIAVLKSTVVEKDAKPYQMIFSYSADEFYDYQKNLFAAMAYNMWISDNTTEKMEKLNGIFFSINQQIDKSHSKSLIEVGKEYYHQISNARKALEDSARTDLLNLYDFKKIKRNSRDGIRKIKID